MYVHVCVCGGGRDREGGGGVIGTLNFFFLKTETDISLKLSLITFLQ